MSEQQQLYSKYYKKVVPKRLKTKYTAEFWNLNCQPGTVQCKYNYGIELFLKRIVADLMFYKALVILEWNLNANLALSDKFRPVYVYADLRRK